jgi:2-dehydropantoate 2-reductase
VTRFVVVGAGAVGGVVAARLAQAGHEVVAIARGEHGAAIREHGLTLECGDQRDTVDVAVAATPGEIALGDGDVVLLGVKSQDTAAALDALRAAAAPQTPVVCVQNGVDNERVALRRFPNVYGVCVMCPTGHLVPGVVQAYSFPVTGIMDVGRFPAGVDATAETVADALSSSTFVSQARPDVMRWKYRKLLMNLANAVEALCGAEFREHELVRLARAEGEACLTAAGIDVASEAEDRERRGDLLRLRPIAGQRRGGGSTWQSLERGKGSVETDHLNGEIVLLGRLHGVALWALGDESPSVWTALALARDGERDWPVTEST